MPLPSNSRMQRAALRVLATAFLAAVVAGCQAPLPDEQDEALQQSEQAARDAATPSADAASSAPPVGSCDASQVQGLVGQAFTDAAGEQATADASAQQLRVLKPDTAATMDFVGERLNIELDEKGVVTGVRCG